MSYVIIIIYFCFFKFCLYNLDKLTQLDHKILGNNYIYDILVFIETKIHKIKIHSNESLKHGGSHTRNSGNVNSFTKKKIHMCEGHRIEVRL